MFKGVIGMGLDMLGQMRFMKGIKSKKAIEAVKVKHNFLSCTSCGKTHGVTLQKVKDDYICTHCVSHSAIVNKKRKRA
jgi:Zn finger protein HypA/HybF involved in hydrogenase expression